MTEYLARLIVICRSSRGWRSTSNVCLLNSGRLITKEHTIVSQTNFSRHGVVTAANKSYFRNSVVRCTERPLGDKGGTMFQGPGYGVNLCGLKTFAKG